MATPKQFSEKERDYHAYQARQNFLREQRTLEAEREREQERQKNAAMQAELERLKALLERH